MRLAKYLAHAGVASRRAAERLIADGRVTRRRRDRHRPRARRRRAARAVARRRAPRRRRRRAARRLRAATSRAGVVSTAQRHARAPDRRRPRPRAGDAPVPGRAPRRRHHRPDPADQRRRARQPPHAPELRGAQDLPRARSARPPVSEPRAAARCATGVELEDGRTAPARVRRLRPDELELTIHEGRKRQVRRMCEAVGHPVRALERVRVRAAAARRPRGGRAPAPARRAPRLRAPGARRPLARGMNPRRMRLFALRGATPSSATTREAILDATERADARDPGAQRLRAGATS